MSRRPTPRVDLASRVSRKQLAPWRIAPKFKLDHTPRICPVRAVSAWPLALASQFGGRSLAADLTGSMLGHAGRCCAAVSRDPRTTGAAEVCALDDVDDQATMVARSPGVWAIELSAVTDARSAVFSVAKT